MFPANGTLLRAKLRILGITNWKKGPAVFAVGKFLAAD